MVEKNSAFITFFKNAADCYNIKNVDSLRDSQKIIELNLPPDYVNAIRQMLPKKPWDYNAINELTKKLNESDYENSHNIYKTKQALIQIEEENKLKKTNA